MMEFSPDKLAVWTGGRWTARPGAGITGFSQDTRNLGAGGAFVALKTEKRDGHDFLADAKARGAAAAIVSHEVRGTELAQLVVDDSLAAFQRIAREHRREFHGTVIGVSGSAGKTSTKDLLALLLGGAPRVLATEGNLNNHIGVPLSLTRIDPAVHRTVVIEAGINMPGEMGGLAGMIEPDHSVITFVGPAHLERLGSLERVAYEKSRLPAANRPGGLAVFPVSCWEYESFRALENPLVLVPANQAMVKVTARTISFTVLHRPERTEVALDGGRPFVMPRVSGGMAQNAALAIALARELREEEAALRERLADWKPARWRGELVRRGEAVVYCDFYNANPASMQDAITAFSGLAPADRPHLYVIGGMEELGAGAAEFHRQLGRTMLLRPGDRLFAIGEHAESLRTGLLENGNDPAQIEVVETLEPVRRALEHFGGAAFLKGSRRHRLELVLGDEREAEAKGGHA